MHYIRPTPGIALKLLLLWNNFSAIYNKDRSPEVTARPVHTSLYINIYKIYVYMYTSRLYLYMHMTMCIYSKSPLIRRPKIRKTRNDGTFVQKSHCRINPIIRHILKIFECAPRDLQHFFCYISQVRV